MLVVGHQSQLEVRKNLNLFQCKVIFAYMVIVFLSVFMVMSMHPCFSLVFIRVRDAKSIV